MLLTEQRLHKKYLHKKNKKDTGKLQVGTINDIKLVLCHWSHQGITDGVASNTVNFKVKPKDRLHLFSKSPS